VEIEDLDGATVRQRYRGREMQHRVWPNIIIYFPLEYGVTNLLSNLGSGNAYKDNWTNEMASKWRATTDDDERDRIAREFGNHAFENYVNMPLFWFPHTVAVDPSVVSDWVYPGSTVPRGGHLHSVKAAAK
jgi:ABC-type transport system substrate-binding protein